MGAAAKGNGNVSLPATNTSHFTLVQLNHNHYSLYLQRVTNVLILDSATPVYRSGPKGKLVNVPDHKPPPGYICYRCGEKGKPSIFHPFQAHHS